MLLNKIEKKLKEMEKEINNQKLPETMKEAFVLELNNKYCFYSLKIIKGKLFGNVDKNDIQEIKNLKKYFKMIEENEILENNSEELISKLYGS